MAYATYEGSVEGGRPVEIYTVVAGATTYHLTSAEDDVDPSGAQTFTAVEGLRRSETKDGPDDREYDFKLELPTSHALAQIFTGVLPGFRVRLTVQRYQRDDTPTPEIVTIFDGYVQGAKFPNEGKKTVLAARTTIASLGRQIPRRTYQSACNHILYDPLTCRVDDTLVAFRASALGVSGQMGNMLTLTSGLSGVYADGFMNGGYVQTIGGANFRLILDHVGNVLTLLMPFSATPTSVDVFAGCDHTIQICGSKFSNVEFFGGFAFVPTKNVVESGIYS